MNHAQQMIESLDTAMLDNLNISDMIKYIPQHLRPYIQVSPSLWLYKDQLYDQIKAMPVLYNSGKVVWASMVQANWALFQPEWASCAGEIVFDPSGNTSPASLRRAAEQLFALKGTSPINTDQQTYATHLTNENTRIFNHPFPQSLAPIPLKMSSIWFEYRHLPGGILSMYVFPIIISEKCPNYAMVLPSFFWPKGGFKDLWEAISTQKNGGSMYDVEKDTIARIRTGDYRDEICLEPKLPEIFDIVPDQKLSKLKQTIVKKNNQSHDKISLMIKFKWALVFFAFALLFYLLYFSKSYL